MSHFRILSRYTNACLWEGDAESLKDAVEKAVLSGSDLSGSNLRWSDLRGSDLSGSDLSWSNLSWSNLSGSNLSGSDLSGLKGYNWQSHELISAILLRHAGDSVSKRALAGLILVSPDWCWKKFLSLKTRDRAWAISILKPLGAPIPEEGK
jgi:uncharacterized protein YjbI with pentapeptide repeats